MIKTVFTAALALAAVAPAAAQASEARAFSHEGVNYSYTTQQRGKVTVINGATKDGTPFRLYVKNGKVTGTYNNHDVSFTTAEATKANLAN